MNAVISGTAGRALLVDGKSLKSFDVDDPSKLVVRQQSDLPYMFGEGQDLRIIENSDFDSIARELRVDSDLNLALDLTLISLDDQLEEDIRKDTLQDLNELLADKTVVERLENILYARPLSDDGDLTGALELCSKAHARNIEALLRRFQEHQPIIEEVSTAWETIPTKVFGSYDHKAEFQHFAVREGLFRELVMALAVPHHIRRATPQTEVQGRLSKFFLEAGLNPSVKNLRNHRQVMQYWTDSFRLPAEAVTITQEIEDEEREVAPRRRRGRRVDINREAVLREVNNKKEVILGAMKRRDLDLIDRLVDDLVSYQLVSGETKHAAKSLCDLAIEARALGLLPLRLELTKRSISIAPDDYWSWAQYGDALLSLQRLDEALEAYQQSEDFGAGVLARTGSGEALKAKGEFEAALAAFDEVIRQHPENAVAKTGRAEVLKTKGDLDAALTAYNEVISQHPENAVARNGRSCILAALGRYGEALEELPDRNPVGLGDWIGLHIRGMILMRIGRIQDAVHMFQRGVSNDPFPSSVPFFQTALAVALIRQEKYEDASSVLNAINAPNLQPQIDILRLHVSGEKEEFEEAKAAFDDLTPKPWSISEELIDELHRRYILRAPAKRSDDWLFDQEVGTLLLVANQQASISLYAY